MPEQIVSLTKENFWNRMMERYPVQMKQFCDWIDLYKKRIQWDVLFLNGIASDLGKGDRSKIKYHNIPIAMQFGIFIQFTSECGWKYSFSVLDHPHVDEFSYMITKFFDDNNPAHNEEETE